MDSSSIQMKTIYGILFVALMFVISGCAQDADPQAKVDSPGYYNGPMTKNKKNPEAGATQSNKGEKAVD